MDIERELREIINEIKLGDKAKARETLRGYIKANPKNEMGWWIYAKVAESEKERIYCFEKVIMHNPNNEKAHDQLKRIKNVKNAALSTSMHSQENKRLFKNRSIPKKFIIGLVTITLVVLVGFLVYVFYFQPQRSLGPKYALSDLFSPCNKSYIDRLSSFHPKVPFSDKVYPDPITDSMLMVYEIQYLCDMKNDCEFKKWVIYEKGEGCEVALSIVVNGSKQTVPMFYINTETDYVYPRTYPLLFDSQKLP